MNERLEDIINHRKKKLQNLLDAGIDPYPSETSRTHSNAEVIENFESFTDQQVTLVGRIRSLRGMGKLIFAHIDDGNGRIQVLLKADDIGDQKFSFFLDNYDLGDFIEATGTLFITKTGEKTLQASDYKMLAKSFRPLPSEHFGIEDIELKLRKRYLDILLDNETKELFVKKAKFWGSMRKFLENHNFLEMQMPILESTTGGAEAEPFITHHNALDRDFYLRISLELPLKKMLVAGYEKVFEIGRIFRNEGISTTHLQDYTQMEFYWAYGDFEKMMKFVQEMYQYILQETFGTLQITSGGVTCNWSGDWEKVDYIALFKEHTGLDLETCSDEDLKKYAKEQHIKFEDFAQRGRLIDVIFKKVRVNLRADKPLFLINQPIELEPLAKRDPSNPKVVQRMQIVAYGTELGKGFGELNDPIDQRKRFEDQAKLREAGDNEAQMLDEEYVEAMEYGMPPAAGFGVSERLFAMLADRAIRETVIFPPMKAEGNSETGKSKETKIAVAILNEGATLEQWQKLNTIAHLTASLGAREGKGLLYQDSISTKDGVDIVLNIQHAIMIKSAQDGTQLKDLITAAKQSDLEVTEFTREMIETTNDKKVIEQTANKTFDEVEYLGVLVFGNKSQVEELTKKFELAK
jgi:lysyl-tRNA synthetase, class II